LLQVVAVVLAVMVVAPQQVLVGVVLAAIGQALG
jgi:hypothetical protein